MNVSNKEVGAFIDAVYAIAVTILALEIPSELNGEFTLAYFGGMLLDYVISFVILFALWLQHRRINAHNHASGRLSLWLNGGVLLLVCLIPRATSLVFQYGGDVMLAELEGTVFHRAGWTQSEVVDLAYIGIILAADLGLLWLHRLTRAAGDSEELETTWNTKLTISLLVLIILTLSLVTPLQNRYFLLLIPLVLMFEHKLEPLIFRRK